jgi:hypothetical protein
MKRAFDRLTPTAQIADIAALSSFFVVDLLYV